jgi:hypothetical protein
MLFTNQSLVCHINKISLQTIIFSAATFINIALPKVKSLKNGKSSLIEHIIKKNHDQENVDVQYFQRPIKSKNLEKSYSYYH